MIFAARQIQEKSREQRIDLYTAFTDLSKAFDTVNRELLWTLLERVGAPTRFLNILRQIESMQRALDVISGICSSLGLQNNTQKTENFVQPIVPPIKAPQFYSNGDPIKIVNQFKYLGGTLTPTSSLDMEIQTRINLTSAAFERLRTRVFLNNDLKYGTKTAVYLAVCISTLSYASETWTPYRRQIQMLENFHTRCLKRIFGISWEDRLTHEELYRRSNTTNIEAMLAKRHLRWLGQVIRIPDHRLPRQILYGKLSHGNRSAGGQKTKILGPL
ncbi:uncharacterized protein LOC121877470 [Homarus americanus]|uniref:uncharacterized protein LOC121877470 n=1 Tax=Homarus americanus TaxID=6706 RepID=UPI001C48798D|nr:uncharacterized protein LOC121877470 [Homarus americanus]